MQLQKTKEKYKFYNPFRSTHNTSRLDELELFVIIHQQSQYLHNYIKWTTG